MAFITGLMLIDAPASALNNSESRDIEAQVKKVYVPQQGDYPYASAQAYRYWLRETLDKYFADEWQASPVHVAGKGARQQAYTEGDPIQFPDDDLFGYMRATPDETLTRVAPFRTSTLMSIAPVQVTSDFGVMARGKKEAEDRQGVLLHQHQFYRTVLKGLFSIDLNSVGTFTNQNRSGYQNLSVDANVDGLEKAQFKRFQDTYDAYRLPADERTRRVQVLLRAMGRVEGGAKQALHYTDVTPAFVIAVVTRGGNHIFGHLIRTNERNEPEVNSDSLDQIRMTLQDDLLSRIYVGCVAGFMDSSQPILEQFGLTATHPRQALDNLAEDLVQHPDWMG